MKNTLESRFLVVDDILQSEPFNSLQSIVANSRFQYIRDYLPWNQVYDINNENILYGDAIKEDGSALSQLTNTLRDIALDFSKPAAEDIRTVSRLVLHPRGNGLKWHDDSNQNDCAFIYYLHPTWNCEWGGELIISNHAPLKSGELRADTFSGHLTNNKIMETGIGSYVLPKPNRAVFILPGTLHCIKPVSEAAGNNCRISLTGFIIPNVSRN